MNLHHYEKNGSRKNATMLLKRKKTPIANSNMLTTMAACPSIIVRLPHSVAGSNSHNFRFRKADSPENKNNNPVRKRMIREAS